MDDRILFYKHADANFYSSWPYAFGRAIAQIPQVRQTESSLSAKIFFLSLLGLFWQTMLDTLMFAVIFYYMVGLADRESVSNFVRFLVIVFLFSLLSNQQMAMFASFASESSLQVYGAVVLLLGILFGGFILAPDAIPAYYDFIYWCEYSMDLVLRGGPHEFADPSSVSLTTFSYLTTGNPFAWAYRALIVNEFRSGAWDDPDSILLNNGFVKPNGDPFEEKWVGYGCLFMLVYYLICCVLTAVFLGSIRNTGEVMPPEKKPSISEADLRDDVPPKVEIPFKPLTLSFHDLCYQVTASTSKEKLTLLKSVNGIFRPGRLCALMGSSGAVSNLLSLFSAKLVLDF